jgi:hypothetical protein
VVKKDKSNDMFDVLLHRQVAEGSSKVFEKTVSDILEEGGCPTPQNCLLTAYIDSGSGVRVTATNAYYFVSWKDAQGLQNPNVQVSCRETVKY